MSANSERTWASRWAESKIDTVRIAGLSIAAIDPNEAVLLFNDVAKRHDVALDVHLINAYSIALADRDTELQNTFEEASLVLPDGRPLARLARFRSPAARQVRGPAFFESCMDTGRQQRTRHFLLGGSPETLRLLESALSTKFPGINIVGSESPPFRTLSIAELDAQDDRIRATNPDVVWVGLGTPKQDFEAQRIAKSTGITAVAVGAAFDFTAGTRAEAPNWVSKLYLEWAFRFASEPRRLWKRYIFGNAQFVRAVMRHQ